MEDLLTDLMLKIFQNLKLKDLLNARLVCKRFNHTLHALKINELILNDNTSKLKSYWFHRNQLIDYKRNANKFNLFLKCIPIFNLNVNLKRLHLSYFHPSNLWNLKNLNSRTQLEHLELN